MDKNSIKKFAVWARRELISRVSQRAYQYGITEDSIVPGDAASVNGVVLSADEIRQRKALIDQINAKDYRQVMEEVAYTWFNRFMALRFMEVNSYLPSRVRVFTDADNRFKPQILTEAIDLELDGLDIDRVFALKDANDDEALFKYLLITQCNALSAVLPGMFQRICDYTELLFPDNLLRDGSVVEQMIAMIPQEDWTDQVQIIGWLYQYYNTEPFNAIFDGDKSRKTIEAHDIPAATQLFTPDWAVRYMVENSLGRIWIEGHPDSVVKDNWTYFLEEVEQEPSVQQKLNRIRLEYSQITPEQIKCIDPCVGSGHILTYLFDILMQIYIECGYSTREAVQSIVENNLHGLDIDERATQLAYFAVMMKARQYDRRFLSRGIQPKVCVFIDSNTLDRSTIAYFVGNDSILAKDFSALLQQFQNAKELGSIIKPIQIDWDRLYSRLNEIENDISVYQTLIQNSIVPFIRLAEVLNQKYDVVITNPPYLNSARMSNKLQDYIKKHYEEAKADFSSVMYLVAQQNFSKKNGFISFITTNSWMYLKSFVKVRNISLTNLSFTSIVDYGTELFEGKIGHLPIVAWVSRNAMINQRLTAVRLVDYRYGRRAEKYAEFFNSRNYYFAKQSDFYEIEGAPIVYWFSSNVLKSFQNAGIGEFAEIVSGMTTGDNDKYLRMWFELSTERISFEKNNIEDINLSFAPWIPYHKGGEQRKWYGNHEYVVNWGQSSNFNRAKTTMTHVYLQPCITWSDISGNSFAGRYCYGGFMFDVKGSCAFSTIEKLHLLIGLFNSKVTPVYVEALNPTSTTQVGDLKRIPYIEPSDEQNRNICELVDSCVYQARSEWDAFEFSWDFKRHPLVALRLSGAFAWGDNQPEMRVSSAFKAWELLCEGRFEQLKANEEELNRIFIDIYGLGDELTPEVEDKDVTVRKADLGRDIRSLISYAVGCMFGRYSLDCDGLAYAGGEFSAQWAVVGGQYYRKETVGKYVCEELSRVMGLAEGHGSGVRGVSTGQASSEGGAVRAVQPDAQSGSIDPVQHRRGAGTAHNQGIYQFSLDCQGFPIGAGDTDFDLSSPEILDAIASGDGTKLVAGGWKNAERIDWKAIHCALTTSHFSPTADNIIPICDDDYFADDLTGRFIRFIETVYGSATLEENLRFIADALGGKGQPKEVIRNYFLNDFYADHLKIYQKRPIYWLFDSGKKGGFKALIYMHRYQPDTIARLRTDYVHEQQSRYRTAIADLVQRIPGVSTSERVKLSKKLKKLQEQSTELQTYEEKIHHLADQFISIDLDDGVKKNYAIFGDVLAKIK